MRSLHTFSIAVLLVAGPAAGLAQDKPYYDVEVALPDNAVQSEPESLPWPDFMPQVPQPGLYRIKANLVSITFPELDALAGADMEARVRETFPETSQVCVTGEEESRDLLQHVTSRECADPQITIDGKRFTVSAQCHGLGEEAMAVELDGTVNEMSARINYHVTSTMPGMGELSVHFRTSTRRIGDCPTG